MKYCSIKFTDSAIVSDVKIKLPQLIIHCGSFIKGGYRAVTLLFLKYPVPFP